MKGNVLHVFCMGVVFLTFVTTHGMASSLQAMGSWWEAGDSGSTYGLGVRTTLGDLLALDLGWTSFGEGDDVHVDIPGDNDVDLGGINANVFDVGARYTLPMALYLGGGLSYFDFDHDAASIDGEWGIYGLVGWSFGGKHVRGFMEGMYRYTEGTIRYNDHRFAGTVDSDVDHDGLGLNVGIMYRF